MIDSNVIGYSARDEGGCIALQHNNEATLRNVTLSSCSAPDGPYMQVATTFAATTTNTTTDRMH